MELPSLRGPYFDRSVSRNVTALVGRNAFLYCRVRNLGNRTVSVSIFVIYINSTNLRNSWVEYFLLYKLWMWFLFAFTKHVAVSGILDTSSRSTFINCWQLYLHLRPEILHHPFTTDRRMDSADSISTNQGFRVV